MENQKIENQLNLALDASKEERIKSIDLEVGFHEDTKSWEVIVKIFGEAEELLGILQEQFPNDYNEIQLESLSSNYAIMQIPEQLVDAVAQLPEIEYMEKPKRLFFAVNQGKSASCINLLQTGAGSPAETEIENESAAAVLRDNLTGKGILVAVVDSGERVIIMSDTFLFFSVHKNPKHFIAV